MKLCVAVVGPRGYSLKAVLAWDVHVVVWSRNRLAGLGRTGIVSMRSGARVGMGVSVIMTALERTQVHIPAEAVQVRIGARVGLRLWLEASCATSSWSIRIRVGAALPLARAIVALHVGSLGRKGIGCIGHLDVGLHGEVTLRFAEAVRMAQADLVDVARHLRWSDDCDSLRGSD